MTAVALDRNRRLRQRRTDHESLRSLGQSFGLSRWRVDQLLEATGGDPLSDVRLTQSSERELARYRDRLVERVRHDLRTLAAVEEEIEVRRVDRIAGVGSG